MLPCNFIFNQLIWHEQIIYSVTKSTCILKADMNFNKDRFKFCNFAPFLMFSCGQIFQPNKMTSTNCVDVHTRTISNKLSLNHTSGFRKDVLSYGMFLHFWCRCNQSAVSYIVVLFWRGPTSFTFVTSLAEIE